jgi:hypothetical protein
MTRIIAFAEGIASIVWTDGRVTVVPDSEQSRVESALARQVESWRSVGQVDADGSPVGIEEQRVMLDPGSAEHAALVMLALPGGFIIEGDDALPGAADAI